ncbi:MAG: hypothetical protein ACE5KD_04735 [Candidatus Bathyarchaeia archaeon]
MNEEKFSNVTTLFHSMLLAYQIALRDILGTGRVVFVRPALENFAKINEATGVHLVKGKSLDEAFRNLSKTMKVLGLVKDFRFEKLGTQKYIVHVDDCIWAPETHKQLNTKNLVCPLALIAMSIVQAHSNNKVKVIDSEYFERGTKTRIESVKPK